MKYLRILIGIAGIWFLASAATPNGLLPSGHGMGRVSEIILGVVLVAYAGFYLRRALIPKGGGPGKREE